MGVEDGFVHVDGNFAKLSSKTKKASNHDQCAECSNMQQIACTWEKK